MGKLETVEKLLRQGTSSKLQRHNSAKAKNAITKALELANKERPLDSPWPEICAYRLAHLIMRDGVDADVKMADKLFELAAKNGFLGPLPYIYRMSVISRRIDAENDPGTRKTLRELIEAQQRQAVNAIQNLSAQTTDPDVHEQYDNPVDIQGPMLNLLELATYFSKLSYKPLEGLTTPFFDNASDGHFRDLGFGPDNAEIIDTCRPRSGYNYPWTLAEKIIENEANRSVSGVVLVKFKANGDCELFKRGGWERIQSEPKAHVLYHLLTLPRPTRQSLLANINATATNIDRHRSQWNTDLIEIANLSIENAIHSSDHAEYSFDPKLRLVAIIHHDYSRLVRRS